jgi:hypothetical protein
MMGQGNHQAPGLSAMLDAIALGILMLEPADMELEATRGWSGFYTVADFSPLCITTENRTCSFDLGVVNVPANIYEPVRTKLLFGMHVATFNPRFQNDKGPSGYLLPTWVGKIFGFEAKPCTGQGHYLVLPDKGGFEPVASNLECSFTWRGSEYLIKLHDPLQTGRPRYFLFRTK